ncbi:ATP-binding protein [Synechococcus sp. ATX 2A4]|uniref:AAA family ATPase n=1 Tax=Synechococcus sp. ATX 2A4 TaxID=2823727 RepID=UPI0020CF0695|nr:AAA family ATPase [Synechococcus sp. ATX 2A4]MCP9884245.1 ATP-binding protein [Synechococcus sp. ATX 2A4]
MALPNLWRLYNLRSSPYFQATLRQGSEATPLSLFVGRQTERQRLLSAIGGSRSSRQAVAGRPGIGKTTLVQAVKADALAAGYWTSADIIPITADLTSENLIGQLLAGAFEAVLASCAHASGPAVEAAQQLVRTIRLRGGGFTVSAAGFGAGGTNTQAVSSPPGALLLDGPRALRDLLVFALEQGASGLVLHLNNLENLSEADAARAADLLRSIRDQVLLLDGLHLIVVGTADAVRLVVQSHTQVRSVFSDPVVLEPLEPNEVHQLLGARYRSLRLDPNLPVHAPAHAAVIDVLHELFRGDLRGLLKALEDGITALLGLTGDGESPEPIGLADLTLVLSLRYKLELQDHLGATLWQRLEAWGERDVQAVMTQADLVTLWGIKQPSVSQTLQQLVSAGAADVLPRRGGDPLQYLLTGATRLALG